MMLLSQKNANFKYNFNVIAKKARLKKDENKATKFVRKKHSIK